MNRHPQYRLRQDATFEVAGKFFHLKAGEICFYYKETDRYIFKTILRKEIMSKKADALNQGYNITCWLGNAFSGKRIRQNIKKTKSNFETR